MQSIVRQQSVVGIGFQDLIFMLRCAMWPCSDMAETDKIPFSYPLAALPADSGC